ncbi:hypothetical protein ACKWTF_010198 [Chironomus riparius]
MFLFWIMWMIFLQLFTVDFQQFQQLSFNLIHNLPINNLVPKNPLSTKKKFNKNFPRKITILWINCTQSLSQIPQKNALFKLMLHTQFNPFNSSFQLFSLSILSR